MSAGNSIAKWQARTCDVWPQDYCRACGDWREPNPLSADAIAGSVRDLPPQGDLCGMIGPMGETSGGSLFTVGCFIVSRRLKFGDCFARQGCFHRLFETSLNGRLGY